MEFFWPPKTATDPDAVTDGANLGTGSEIFAGKNGNTLEFKTLVAGSNVTLDETADTITINSSGGGGSGAVFGPGSSTDNAVTRWDGVGGTNVQNSVVTISDTGTISGAESLSLSLLTASRAIVTDGSKNLVSTTTTAAEIGFVNGVTSSIQTQLNAKQATGNYITATTGDVVATGPGSVAATIQTDAVTTTKILNGAVTDAKIAAGVDSVKIANGSVSNTEFQYLDGVTSAIQTQIDAKQPAGNYISALTGEVTANGPGGVAATVTNSAVIGKVLTGYVAGAGTVAATDTILQGMQKLDGNDALRVLKAGDTMSGDLTFANTKGIQVPLNSELRIATANSGAYIVIGDGTSAVDFNAGGFQISTTGTYTDGTAEFTDTVTIDDAKSIRFLESSANGTDYIALKAPASVTASATLTLPDGAGTSGQFLSTNGSGLMSWANPAPVVNSVTSAYTTSPAPTQIVYATQNLAGFNITLHTAVGNIGNKVTVVRLDATAFTLGIRTTSSQTISAAAPGTRGLTLQGQSITLISDGANWWITEFNANAETYFTYGSGVSPASTIVGDVTSLTLAPGNWMIGCTAQSERTSGSLTSCIFGISTFSGNNFSGLTQGSTFVRSFSTAVDGYQGHIVPFPVTPTTSTTYYLKTQNTWTGGLNIYGRLQAQRIGY